MSDEVTKETLDRMNEELSDLLGKPEYKPWLEEYEAERQARRGNIEEATKTFRKLAEDNWGQYGTMSDEAIQQAVVELSTETNRILDFFRSMFSQIWSGFKTFLKAIYEEVIPWIAENVLQLNDESWDRLLGGYEDIGFLDKRGRETLTGIKKMFGPAEWIAHIAIGIQMFTNYVGVIQATMGGKATQNLQSQFRGNLPDPSSVMRAAFVAPEKGEEVRRLMGRAGISDEDQDLMFLAQYATYDVSTLREIFFRGTIDQAKAEERLAEMGYTPERIEEIMSVWAMIPSAQDLLWMVGKEAFEDELASKYGLDDEYPSDVTEWLEKQGVSPFWGRKYWRAHWDAPGIAQGYNLLHRRLINEEDLDALFRIQEIPSFWREKLMKASYYPYTRVDVRRMYERDIIDEQGVYDSYRDQGYDHEKATNLTLFAISEKQAAEKDLTRAQIEAGYKNAVIDRETAAALLVQLGYSDSEAEYMLLLVDSKEEEDYRESVLGNIKNRFLSDIIDEQELRDQLNNIGIPAKKIRVYTEQWQFLKMPKKALPSKTDLDKFYRTSIIKRDEYVDGLRRLGYEGHHITWYATYVEKTKG